MAPYCRWPLQAGLRTAKESNKKAARRKERVEGKGNNKKEIHTTAKEGGKKKVLLNVREIDFG